MKYEHNGIETVYKGRSFRSRLEARWAVFFDFLGWKWEYEPCDFSGWIPDFVIVGKHTVYVEVKPVVSLPQDVVEKIDSSECKDEVLIVGMTIPVGSTERSFGWMREVNGSGSWWEEAVFGMWKGDDEKKNKSNVVGFCHEVGSFADRITGLYDGGGWGRGYLNMSIVLALWVEAGNMTQWKKKGV